MEADRDNSFKAGDPIPGAGAHEPPPPRDAAPDLKVTPEKPPEEKTPKRPLPPASLKKQLADFFGGISFMIAASGDHHCAMIVAEQAEPLAEAWAELAQKNERVRAILTMMLEGSAWGKVFVVTAATVIPIAAHHELLPRNFPMPFSFGIGQPPPPSDEVKRAEDTPPEQE